MSDQTTNPAEIRATLEHDQEAEDEARCQAMQNPYSHTCIADINAKLEEKNTRLAIAFSWEDCERELIGLEAVKADVNMRGKPLKVFASHCPFCGVKLKGMQ